MDMFDEPGYMTYQRPMKYNTPTSYTMLNGWFLDNGDGSNILQYLTGGSIQTTGYSTIDDPVYMLDMDGPTTDFIASDKDKDIEDDGAANDVGPLLAYLNDYPVSGEARIWVRDTNSNGTIADGSAITVEGGTGAGDANGASVSGDELYPNLYTIASFPGSPNPQVYIFQNGERIAEWSAFTNWDRGSIDVLIPVQLGGSLIDSGNVTVFARQTGDTFTFVEADLSSGARTPVATETASDEVNVTKGEWYLLYDNEAGAGFAENDVIQNTATDSGTPPDWYAEVHAITDWGSEGLLTLRSLRGSITDDDAIYIGTTQRGLANGTPGDTYVTYDAEATGPLPADIGEICTGDVSTAKRILRGYQDDGSAGKLVLQADATVSGTGRDAYYKDYADNDELTAGGGGSLDVTLDADSTTLIAGYTDVTVAHMNGTVDISSLDGTFIPGEKVTWNAGTNSAILISVSGTTLMALGNVDPSNEPDAADVFYGELSEATADCDSGLTDDNTQEFAFTQQDEYEYSVFVEGGSIYEAGRSLSDIYSYLQYICRDGSSHTMFTSTGAAIVQLEGQEYIKGDAAYTANKGAPFGGLAGDLFQGAQGVWVQGMQGADANNISLTDDLGNVRTPYATIQVTIGNTRVDDVIAVYLEDGSTELPDKAQYESHISNNVQSDSTFDKDAGSFPIDTPDAGTFIVVASGTALQEHRYRYTSWDTGTLSLATEVTGQAETGTTGTTLKDPGVFSSGVERGDIIRNTTDASWGYIEEVVSNDEVTTTIMRNAAGAAVGWEVNDNFEINSLIETYDNTDKFFIPYIDSIEDTGTDGSPGSESVNILYLTPRSVVIRVRNVEAATPIQPFVTTSDITSAGMTVSVIRTEDEVYTEV